VRSTVLLLKPHTQGFSALFYQEKLSSCIRFGAKPGAYEKYIYWKIYLLVIDAKAQFQFG
jgi:hypothetical protein